MGSENDNPDDELIRYVELYDLKKKRWQIIAEDQPFDEPLIDDVLPDGVEDHPYAILPGWNAIVGPEPRAWPYPYTRPWIDPQKEYNIRRQQMMEGAKRSARKILATPNSFPNETEALKAVQSPRDMEPGTVTSR